MSKDSGEITKVHIACGSTLSTLSTSEVLKKNKKTKNKYDCTYLQYDKGLDAQAHTLY